MKRMLLIAGALIALTAVMAPLASAAGPFLGLGWSDCKSGGGAQDDNFACGTNTGVDQLIGTFTPAADVPLLTAFAAVIDLQTNQAALTDWWHMESGGCRAAVGPLASMDFTGGPFGCTDFWNGPAVGAVVLSYDVPGVVGANSARIRVAGSSSAQALANNVTEYYGFKVTIRRGLTTGAGSCAGCTDAACFVLNSMQLFQPAGSPGGDPIITTYDYVTWRGGTGAGLCPDLVPTKKSTWGSVKALYR